MNRLLGMLAVAAIAAATPAYAQIKIATVGPMTGQYAAFGEQMKRGAEMAVKDINAAGGVNGQQLVLYTALISMGLRFFDYALAGGELWSIGGFFLGWVVQFAIAAFAYRLTRARQMVRQYPWLYESKGLLGWEERH